MRADIATKRVALCKPTKMPFADNPVTRGLPQQCQQRRGRQQGAGDEYLRLYSHAFHRTTAITQSPPEDYASNSRATGDLRASRGSAAF